MQIESDNVGVHLHFLERSADLSLLTSKTQEISLSAVHLWAVSKGVLFVFFMRKFCGK